MSDTIKDLKTSHEPAAGTSGADHDAWFRKQVQAGLKEAAETPELCVPMEEVLKDLNL